MVFSIDKNLNKIIATIQYGGRTEKYECIISACDNPVCTCANIYLELIPMQFDCDSRSNLRNRKVEIDIDKRTLGYKDKKKISKEDLKFSRLFLSKLNENDYQLLYKNHFAYKNKISDNAPLEIIEGYFDYQQVEQDGLMYAYNDILPYGDQFHITINGKNCIIIDQYCLLPKCSCTDTNLDIMQIDKLGNTGKELCFVALNYKKKQWKLIDESPIPMFLETVRSKIEEQLPDIYREMQTRHKKLKAIYANCKKRHFSVNMEPKLPKPGRNDPCPCGSGKKYKKCCLG